jgi:hypothetical protein
MILGRALGAILKYNWYRYWRRNIVLCCIHLIRVSWWSRVTPFWNVCPACFSTKPTISLKRYSGDPAFESMR